MNLEFEISKKDNIKFCIIKGGPIINLKIIRYSRDEFSIKSSILLTYFLYFFLKNIFKKYFDKIKKQKQPIVDDIKQIINDIIIPKAKPPKTQKSNNPGKESVEYKIINIKKIKIENK